MKSIIHIKFWGVRGSTPCPNPENMRYGGNTTCVQIQVPQEQRLLVLDSGTGFRNLGNELERNGKPVEGRIFITHPHWDHLQGFPFFKPFYDAKNCFHVYMPPQGKLGCDEIIEGHMSSTFFPVSVDMLQASLTPITIEPGLHSFENYSVEYMLACHTVPTAIYKLHIGSRVIIFAPDNELKKDDSPLQKQFEADFRAFIHEADVLIHDAHFNRDEHQDRIGWGHSAWEDVVEIAKQEGVKRLYLTHHSPDSNDNKLAEIDSVLKEQHAKGFEQLHLAVEGEQVELPV